MANKRHRAARGPPCPGPSPISWCPKKGHPPWCPPTAFVSHLKAPTTSIPRARRMRNPGLALPTKKPGAEGWWQVQEETPGVPVLSPARWGDQTPPHLHEPPPPPQISTKSSQTSAHAAFGSQNTPNPRHQTPSQDLVHLPRRVPVTVPAWKTSTSQTSLPVPLRITGTHGQTHPSAIKIL